LTRDYALCYSLDVLTITIQTKKVLVAKPNPETLEFGKFFTDYMLLANFKDGTWQEHRIVPFAPLALHPASTALHYSVQIFEGLKAYRTPKDEIRLFRPLENLKRFNTSAERLCLPKIKADDWLDMLSQFVKLETDWVPYVQGT